MDQKENREKKLIRCLACNKPLAVVNGHGIDLVKYNKKDPVHMKVGVKHDAGGRFDISCECGGGFSFSTVQKALPMTYVIADTKKGNAVDKSN